MHLRVEKSYTFDPEWNQDRLVHVKQSVTLPATIAKDVIMRGSIAAARTIEALIARGVEKSEITSITKIFCDQIGDLVNRTIARDWGHVFPEKSVDPQHEPNDMGDVTDAGNPPRKKKSGHRQPGTEDLPHLDADRLKVLAKKPGSATVYDSVSRSVLIERGWERLEDSPDGFEHYVKDEIGEVIISDEGFVVKSMWDGSLSGSEDFADLAEALDSVVG